MARYLSQHTLACLSRQGAAQLARQVHEATQVRTTRVLVNMQEGKMLIELEAADRATVESWFASLKFHFDWLLRIEFESTDGELRPA